jgi:hypothetical protein
MRKVLLLVGIGCCLIVHLKAQTSLLFNRNYHPSRTIENEVVFIYYHYQSNVLNLMHYKSVFPKTRDAFPDEVTILPPDLSLLEDTAYSVAYLKMAPDVPGIPILMIVGNTHTEYPLFFVDKNLDRDFTNDGDPLIFPKEEASKDLEFTQRYQGRAYTYRLNLLNPLNQENLSLSPPAATPSPAVGSLDGKIPISQLPIGRDERQRLYEEAADESRNNSNVAIGFQVLLGFGRITYKYFDPATTYATRYQVGFNSKGVGATLHYRVRRFSVGAYLRYESLFFWSSDKYTRVGEPISCLPGQIQCEEVDNVRRDINQDILPKNRSSYGLNLEYSFRLSRSSHLSPFLNLYAQRYKEDQYISNRNYPAANAYAMGTQYGQEAGAAIHTDVTGTTSVFFSMALTNNGFRPRGFFDRENIAGVRVLNLQGSFGLGTQFRL